MTDRHEVHWEDVRDVFPGCGEFNDENYKRYRCKMPVIDPKLWRLIEAKEWFEDNTFKQLYKCRVSEGKGRSDEEGNGDHKISTGGGAHEGGDKPQQPTIDELDTDLFEFDRSCEEINEHGKFLSVHYVRKENLYPNSHFGITYCVDGDGNDHEIHIPNISIKQVTHFCIRNGYLYISTKDGTIRVFKNATDITIPTDLSHLIGKNLKIYAKTFDESHNCCVVNYGCYHHNQLVKCRFCETNVVNFTNRKTLVEIKCESIRSIDAVNSVCYAKISGDPWMPSEKAMYDELMSHLTPSDQKKIILA